MIAALSQKRTQLTELCRRHHVARLEAFGSAVTGDFDPARSDFDFLVSFGPTVSNPLSAFVDFKEALEALLGRPVDLIEREAIEVSRNYIRRRRILAEAEPIYV